MIFNSEHPSRCGENATDEDVWEFLHQSHQQVRGKRFTLFDSTHNSRITPADAGKTNSDCSMQMYATGSPPRMRGKLYGRHLLAVLNRITPAGAGKTVYFKNRLKSY